MEKWNVTQAEKGRHCQELNLLQRTFFFLSPLGHDTIITWLRGVGPHSSE